MSGVSEGHNRYRHWSITDFGGGYIDGIEDSQLPINASKDCSSVISNTIGSLESRPGQEVINPGAGLGGPIQGLYSYYYNTSDKALMVVCNGKIGHWNLSTNSFVQLSSGYDTTAPTLFETCVNFLVGFNGVNAPWKWNGSTFSALANAPTAGRLPVLHKEKLFCVAPAYPSTLRWSDSFMPELWPGVNYWDISKGDGDEITSLVKFLGELVIFKKRSTHSFKGTSLDDFSLQEVDARVGCVGPRAVAQLGTYLYVVAEDGIYKFNGIRFSNLTNIIIPKFWGRVNQAVLHKAAVTVWGGKIWFSLPIDNSTSNNVVLVYTSTSEGETWSWWPWGNMDISCFSTFSSGEELVLYTGHSSTGWIVKQDEGRLDVGFSAQPRPVGAYWESAYFDFGIAGTEKKTKRAFVEVSQDTGALNPEFTVAKNYGDYEDLILERADDMIRQYRFVNRDRWRYMSLRVGEHDDGGFTVRGILIPFKPKMKPKVRGGYMGDDD